ncbi:MAG TPA: diaminopimelate epimerase [Propionicimonas sp.]|mgnify:CR=1 FL=1|jgi:diaminopimelate epimerase|nr:diaminopimelate epimerase [Propionicimonas sp.]
MREISFVKGHGTLNDFVLLADPDRLQHLSGADVALLCDRRAGVGGDGILRAVRAGHLPDWDGDPDTWFMDYRNADGSLAEMCGNGLRVFVRYLLAEGLANSERVTVLTRAGLRTGEVLPDGRIAVTMGAVAVGGPVEVDVAGRTLAATAVDVGNPHAVCVLPEGEELAGFDLATQPTWRPADAFPAGVNVELVERVGPGRLRMRVHERGSGETWSCGTGVVAAAAVAGEGWADGHAVRVEVPGGSLEVRLLDGEAVLTGPAVLVARGTIDLDAAGGER